MAQFKYQARDKTGKHISGVEEALEYAAAVETLRERGLFPIMIEPVNPVTGPAAADTVRLSETDLVFLTRQISNLLGAGVSLPRALDMLMHQTNTSAIRRICTALYDSITGGETLWENLAKYPSVFPRVYVGMVKAAELGGDMEKVFEHLADYMEQKKELRDTLISMLMYPFIVLAVGLGAVIFLMTFVIPRMIFVFFDSDMPLPLLTKLLIAGSMFLSRWWWLIVLAVIGGGIALGSVVRQRKYRVKIEELVYRAPWLGQVLQKIIFIRFCYVMSMLLSNGLSILHCLDISRESIPSKIVLDKLDNVRQRVAQGGALSVSMRQEKIFPAAMVDMIAVGEETGFLERTLGKVARIYDKEVREEIKRMLTITEPVLILAVAVVVGLLVAAMLLPIFQFNLNAL